jgi:hypothetical protein
MAGNCEPPYPCGTGGFCDCTCGCCPPCPCYDNIDIKYHVYKGVTGGACCPVIEDYQVPFSVTFDGCCLHPISETSPSYKFLAVGGGTVTLTPAGIWDVTGCFCPLSTPNAGNNVKGVINLYNGATIVDSVMAGGSSDPSISIVADNCQIVEVTFFPTASWPGTDCCGGAPDYVLYNSNISLCGVSSFRKTSRNMIAKKVLSRIKKVRYKP